jgi:hypothetical protein
MAIYDFYFPVHMMLLLVLLSYVLPVFCIVVII